LRAAAERPGRHIRAAHLQPDVDEAPLLPQRKLLGGGGVVRAREQHLLRGGDLALVWVRLRAAGARQLAAAAEAGEVHLLALLSALALERWRRVVHATVTTGSAGRTAHTRGKESNRRGKIGTTLVTWS